MSAPDAGPSAPRWTARQRAMLREMGLRGVPLPERARPAPGPAEPEPVMTGPAGPAGAEAVRPLATVRPSGRQDLTQPPGPSRPPHSPPSSETPEPPEPDRAPPRSAGSGPALPTPAVQGPAAAPDWEALEALEAEVSACRACRLCEGRSRTVFGTGSPRAHWMVVGEAPGEEEDRRGEPFVGKSGQLLDAMLQAIGLSRAADAPPEQAVYIANAVKCRPPGNRNPQPDELARCEPFLLRQLALVQPRMLLAMGRFAVQSLLRSDEPIGRLRGQIHQVQGVPLVVTYHPAYLLRSPQEKARAWDDLCRARALSAAGTGAGAPAGRGG